MRRPATFRGITARSWDTRECYLAELCQRVQEKTAPNLGPVFPSEILESQGYSSERGRLRHHQTREPKRETPMQKTLRTRGKSRRSQTHFRRDSRRYRRLNAARVARGRCEKAAPSHAPTLEQKARDCCSHPADWLSALPRCARR